MNKINTTPQLVQDRKTGQWYDPAAKFNELINSKFFQDTMIRMKNLWYNLIMNKMTLSFADLNIKPLDYNGTTFAKARAEIINKACDTIMHYFFMGYDEHECLFNVADSHVDMVLQTVTIETATFSLQ